MKAVKTISLHDIQKESRLKFKNKKNAYLDDNAPLSDYVPSPRPKEVSEEEYLSGLVQDNKGKKMGVAVEGQKGVFSSIGKVIEYQYRTLTSKDYRDKGNDQNEYIRPITPHNYNNKLGPFIEKKKKLLMNSLQNIR